MIEEHDNNDGVKYTEGSDGFFHCKRCDYKSKFRTNLTRHISAEHAGIIFKCDDCDYEAKQRGSIDLHKAAKHDGVVFSCGTCAYKSGWKSALKQHLKTHQQQTRSEKEETSMACNECNLEFQTRQGLKQHKEVKHVGSVYPCTSCEF